VYITVVLSHDANCVVGLFGPRTGCGFDVSSLNSETFHALSLFLNHQLVRRSPVWPRTTLMTDLLPSYNALSASSPRADVSKVLNAIISGLSLIP